MTDPDNANSIDRRLRDVPLPPGLLARLREIAALGDAELDHLLGDVSLPSGLLDRLRRIGTLSDGDLDDEARDVPLPAGLRARLTRQIGVARRERARRVWIGWAVAASLMVVGVGAAFFWYGRSEIAQVPPGPGQRPATMVENKGRDGGMTPDAGNIAETSSAAPQTDEPSDQPPTGENPPDEFAEVGPREHPQIAVPDFPRPDTDDGLPLAVIDGPGRASPEVVVPSAPLARGMVAPAVPGYDLPFELKNGAQPFLDPGANAALRESRPPLWTSTRSYELASRLLEDGILPPSSLIHTEDFLAAMDYAFPPPTDKTLAIRAAAGPSPWGPRKLSLLQIGVQAAVAPRDPSGAADLTLVIENSIPMQADGRLWQIRRGVARLVDQLGPNDRLSIVLFDREARVLLRQADRGEAQRALAAWPDATSAATVGVAAALDLGLDIALHPAPADGDKRAARIELLADGMTIPDSRSVAGLKRSLHDAVAAGVDWEMIDARPDDVLDEVWQPLATIGGRPPRHAAGGAEVGNDLLDALAGQSLVVADGARMVVTFNPAAVSRYRLIGHESTDLGGLSGAPLEAKLRSGEAATALYEVELKPDGAEEVATVEVAWREPLTERRLSIRQAIGRQQFAPLWRETPLSLQLAALAAETGEALRGSYFAPAAGHPLDQVAAFADEVNPALADRPSLAQLRELIDRARVARPAGGDADRSR